MDVHWTKDPDDTVITTTRRELLEAVHRYLEVAGYTDALGGSAWARRIHEAGGPREYRRKALNALDRVIMSLDESDDAVANTPPETGFEGLRETWRERYGVNGWDDPGRLTRRREQQEDENGG